MFNEPITVQELIGDGVLSIGDGYRAKNDELSDQGVPFARAGNINDGFHFEDADKFPEQNLYKVGEKLSRPGDILFTSKGTVGRYAIVEDSTPQFVYSPQLCYWRSNDHDRIDPSFLYYYMQGYQFKSQINGIKGQTDMADYVSLRDQKGLELVFPEIERQRLIASMLAPIDEKIELNRKQNRTLEAIAQALFKRWFMDFEFPDENGRPYKSSGGAMQPSELGEIPVGWEVKPLDQIADYLNGLALQKFPPEDDEFLPVIKIREMKQGVTANSDKASAKLEPKYIVDDGDVLFSWSGSLAVDIWCHGKGALNQHLFKVTSEDYPKWFYYLWTKHHLRAFQAVAADKATTMGHIQRGHLSDALTVCPPDEMLPVLSDTFDPLINKIISCRIESRTLARLRDTLLPKLMSGELRVA